MLLNINIRYILDKVEYYYTHFEIVDLDYIDDYLFNSITQSSTIALEACKHAIFKVCFTRR